MVSSGSGRPNIAAIVCLSYELDTDCYFAVDDYVPSHDEISPFTPFARDRRIAILKEYPQ